MKEQRYKLTKLVGRGDVTASSAEEYKDSYGLSPNCGYNVTGYFLTAPLEGRNFQFFRETKNGEKKNGIFYSSRVSSVIFGDDTKIKYIVTCNSVYLVEELIEEEKSKSYLDGVYDFIIKGIHNNGQIGSFSFKGSFSENPCVGKDLVFKNLFGVGDLKIGKILRFSEESQEIDLENAYVKFEESVVDAEQEEDTSWEYPEEEEIDPVQENRDLIDWHTARQEEIFRETVAELNLTEEGADWLFDYLFNFDYKASFDEYLRSYGVYIGELQKK